VAHHDAGATRPDNLTTAIGLLLARSALSQMDVPTRSSYVMAVVTPQERPAGERHRCPQDVCLGRRIDDLRLSADAVRLRLAVTDRRDGKGDL